MDDPKQSCAVLEAVPPNSTISTSGMSEVVAMLEAVAPPTVPIDQVIKNLVK
jgi:hypothetical protein